MRINYSLHQIRQEQNFSFSPTAYSRFKYGDIEAAEDFGQSLAKGFIAQHGDKLLSDPRAKVVYSSPYSHIPTASFMMKDFFVRSLNRWLAANECNVVQEAKIHRTITYKEDYGEMSADDRLKLIGNDHFHIDRIFAQNKLLLFLDDIRITGSHEKMIIRTLEEHGLDNDAYLVYFAELVNGAIKPQIENYLNYYAIKSIFHVEELVNSGKFKFNTRVIKFLLCYDYSAFKLFLSNQTVDFARELYDLAIGNNYHQMTAYAHNLAFTLKTISQIEHAQKENAAIEE